jgi:hypothetical protein
MQGFRILGFRILGFRPLMRLRNCCPAALDRAFAVAIC